MGEQAPWAPTLVRVGSDSVQAWIGWQIAPVLSRYLGPRRTWRVLGTLGGGALNGRRLSGTVRAVSRSTFLRGAIGAVAGLSILTQTGGVAAAGTSGKTGSDPAPEDIRTLNGRELDEVAMRHLAGPDAVNIVETRALGEPAARMSTLDAVPSSAIRHATDATGETTPPHDELEVSGSEIRHPNGITETSVFFYQHRQRMLLHVQHFSEPLNDVRSSAHRLDVDHSVPNGPLLKTAAWSVNGARPTPVPQAELDDLRRDPCGGCPITAIHDETYLGGQCNWVATSDCLLGAGGCTLCAAPGVGWFKIVTCAFQSCPTAYKACCPSTDPVCFPCAPPTNPSMP
jgi:hypothetical protein